MNLNKKKMKFYFALLTIVNILTIVISAAFIKGLYALFPIGCAIIALYIIYKEYKNL
jgi:hypothetical protein